MNGLIGHEKVEQQQKSDVRKTGDDIVNDSEKVVQELQKLQKQSGNHGPTVIDDVHSGRMSDEPFKVLKGLDDVQKVFLLCPPSEFSASKREMLKKTIADKDRRAAEILFTKQGRYATNKLGIVKTKNVHPFSIINKASAIMLFIIIPPKTQKQKETGRCCFGFLKKLFK
uniref:Uncharacterized protein n=1 Tax=Panagrolaimus sp. PS1159 TaxID=55785 RepID=A0AC35G756_9BILA